MAKFVERVFALRRLVNLGEKSHAPGSKVSVGMESYVRSVVANKGKSTVVHVSLELVLSLWRRTMRAKWCCLLVRLSVLDPVVEMVRGCFHSVCVAYNT